MLNKRLIIIILSCIFATVMVAVGFFSLSVNDVTVEYVLCRESGEQVERIEEGLKSFEGKNLIFTDKEEIRTIIEEDPYMQCVSIEKKFPGKISVKVVERRETYMFSYSDKTYLSDENGFVLAEYNGEQRRDLIRLDFNDVELLSVEIGKNLETDCDEGLKTAFEIAKTVNLTDCIKTMTVEDKQIQTDVIFDTYTNVRIRIIDCSVMGIEKAQKAFGVYDSEQSDYVKSFNELQAYLENGEPVAVWTRYEVSAE